MKLGIIFPERDWTAADIALKIQSLAYNNDIDCYISPKHIARDNNKVFIELNKCNYIIFIAHDVNVPDNITQRELEVVKKKPVLGIVIESFKLKYPFFKEFRYKQKDDVIEYIQNEIGKIKHSKTNTRKHKNEDIVLLMGLTALLIILIGVSSKRDLSNVK